MSAAELEQWRRSLETALAKVDYEHAKESLANLAGTVQAFLKAGKE
jgi:glycyl-tRNA synthetase beta subunit